MQQTRTKEYKTGHGEMGKVIHLELSKAIKIWPY